MTHDELLTEIVAIGTGDHSEDLIDVLGEVLSLHTPVLLNTVEVCKACMYVRPLDAPVIPYPCQTVQAIERHIQ